MSQWEMVKLGEICEILNGFAFQSEKYVDDGIRIVRITNVQKGFFEDNSPCFYSTDSIDALKKYLLQENDLLMSLTGNVGRVAVLTKEFLPAALNQRVACLRERTNNSIYRRYIFHYLNSDTFERKCIVSATGVAQKNMSTEWLKNCQIPLPPLETQEHMAKTLDLATEIIEGYRQKLTELDKLVQSVFYEMFGEGRFSSVSLETVTKKLTDGTHQSPTFTEIGVPFLFVSNIVNNEIEYKTSRFIGEAEYAELIKRTPIELGDILITVVGSYGNVAIVKKMEKFCFQRHIAYIKPDFEEVTSFFLKYALLSTEAQREIERNVRGVAQKTLTLTDLRSLTIPLPPLPLQEQFAKIVEKIEEEKALVQEGLREAEQLFGGLLQGYFEG